MALNLPCPQSIQDCSCDPDPISNYSSETPDFAVELCTVTVPARTGTSFASPCTRTVETPNAANPMECVDGSDNFYAAQTSAQECQDGDPDPPNFYTGTFFNREQTCVVECPDGTSFSWTVPALLIGSAWQGDADARAYALACKRAKANRICFTTDSPLTPCCAGTFASIVIGAQGGTPGYTFAVTSGSIPAGMTFDSVGLLSGTPTASGTSTFDVTVTDDIGSTQVKEFVLRVVNITTTSPLPSGTVGTPYSQALAATGTTGTVVWSLVSSTLPDGLTLSDAGVISGTPTMDQTVSFTASLLDGGGASCEKMFSLEIVAAIGLKAYWAFEAKTGGGNNFIADDTGNGHPISGVAGLPAIVPGKIANCIDSNGLIFDVTGTLTGLPVGDGLTVAGWFQLDAGNPDGNIVVIEFFNGGNPFITLTSLGGDVFLQDDSFAPITSLVPVSSGVWYFYRMWYDPVSDTWSLQINNGTVNSSGIMGLSPSAQINAFQFVDSGPTALLDETGWWTRVLSTTEGTNLYNGGAGITFGNPLLPP